MIDWNGFDKGIIGRKLPSDSTLNNMKKSELIKLLHIADHNHKVLAETYHCSVNNSIRLLKEERNKAIDDVVGKIKLKYLGVHPDELYEPHYAYRIVEDIEDIANKLKAGGMNEQK